MSAAIKKCDGYGSSFGFVGHPDSDIMDSIAELERRSDELDKTAVGIKAARKSIADSKHVSKSTLWGDLAPTRKKKSGKKRGPSDNSVHSQCSQQQCDVTIDFSAPLKV